MITASHASTARSTRRHSSSGVVASHAQIDGHGTAGPYQREQPGPVGVADARRPGCLGHLVAGRHHPDPGAPDDSRTIVSDRCEDGEVRGVEPSPLFDDDVTRVVVRAAPSNVRSRHRRRRRLDGTVVLDRHLERHDGIDVCGHTSAGHDPNRLTAADLTVERLPGERTPDDPPRR